MSFCFNRFKFLRFQPENPQQIKYSVTLHPI